MHLVQPVLLACVGNTAVEHLPHHPYLVGLIAAAATGTGHTLCKLTVVEQG